MILYNHLPLETGLRIKFDIETPNGINLITGDSATGRTFFVKELQKLVDSIISGETHRLNPWLSKNVVVLTHRSEQETIEKIQRHENQLIVIDNADIIFRENPWLVSYIASDKKNQYLIFSRVPNDLHDIVGQIGTFNFDEKTDTFRADYH